eukprot:293425_1
MSYKSPRVLKAKQLYQNGNFIGAKEIILQILSESDNSNNFKLLAKLGDISINLFEYEEAINYYQQSLEQNPSNLSIYIKLGNVLQYNLNRYNESERIYENCIEIDNDNEECWFNYGILKVKQNKFEQAEKCFLKCKNEKGCVNYHYGMLLLKLNNKQKQLNYYINQL